LPKLLQVAGRPVDLCLLDIVMARMDGVTALRTLRAAGWTLPVIAATGNIAGRDREKLLAEGFAFVLLKPFDVWQLHSAISSVMEERSGGGSGHGQVTPAAGPAGAGVATAEPAFSPEPAQSPKQ
jgi:CheY-like chemotaxis protein